MSAATSYFVDEAIAALPEQTHCVYIDYRDEFSRENIAALLDGDEETVFESLWEWEAEQHDYAARQYLSEALSEEDAAKVLDDPDEFDRFREQVNERDASDWFSDLLRNTPAIMVRYSLDHDVAPDSWTMGEEGIEEEARGIAAAAGIDYGANQRALHSLVMEASYGGTLCVLHRSDLADVLKVSRTGGTVTFTDPILLVYDGFNGSGHMEEVVGEVRVTPSPDNLAHDVGPMSWSDGIAGIVHSSCETPAVFSEERS